ncbi:hemolysin family protein [Blattabacterium sp. (Cryptocercus punctulatus) str. Cpu]|uniref:hemolysin family protein n=1 Tax=Blattabacterium sp. (Cryptocercus punctulatus) str. Cpu TaxID=1075399 RepID=UPI0002387244|nr:hemolysin family protein [Blattabacterium sp. (Cryptocercus punctulatus) str. Cpu]AEU09151.1 putative transmembrane CBS domain transporter [Blattabacterium sp. (Cryptocercus punctulatus) str. Cpu]
MAFHISMVFITILLSAFFSGMEMALISSSLFQIELEKEKDSFRSKLLSKSIKTSKKFITTMLIGNTISLVVYGIHMEKLFLYFFPKWFLINDNFFFIFFLETIVSATIILIFGEFIPKIIFSAYSNELLSLLIVPVYILDKILSPITNSIIWISNIFLKFFGEKEDNRTQIFDKEDLIYFVSENIENNIHGIVESEVEIFHKALDFSEKKARECMVPRKEIVSSNIYTSSIDNIRYKFTEKGLSKIIIYKNNIDNVIGYIHYLEILKKPKNIESIIRPVELVHMTTPIREIMDILIKKKKSIAIVLDEYGGTAGMITIEDILEEFLGDIRDEHDEIKFVEKKFNDNEFLFSARLKIDFINAKYKLGIPKSEEYETLGGLIVFHTGSIPNSKEKIIIDDILYIEIKKVSKNKIEEVFLRFIRKKNL